MFVSTAQNPKKVKLNIEWLPPEWLSSGLRHFLVSVVR